MITPQSVSSWQDVAPFLLACVCAVHVCVVEMGKTSLYQDMFH